MSTKRSTQRCNTSRPARFDPEIVGLFASIGIKKDQPFAPDARMQGILTDAVAVGNATARALVFAPRDERVMFYPDRHWGTAFIGGAYDFLNNGERMLDARSLFHYYAAGITPAMAYSKPGTGSAYAFATRWAATWTVARPTRPLFQLPYRLVSFGRSWSMMARLVQYWRPIKSSLASIATKKASRKPRRLSDRMVCAQGAGRARGKLGPNDAQ
jgi:hypothetical protein